MTGIDWRSASGLKKITFTAVQFNAPRTQSTMKKFFAALLALLPFFATAQNADSLFIREDGVGKWHAPYRVGNETSVFGVAKKFGVPAAALADANGLSYADKLGPGKLVKIPLTLANWYNYTPPASAQVAALYYRVAEEMDWKDAADRVGVSKRQLREWNKPGDDDIEAGRALAVGWISLGPTGGTDVVVNSPMPATPPQQSPIWLDTAVVIAEVKPVPVPSPMEQSFLDQTAGGTLVAREKGAAAFFPVTGGSARGVHYAFHSSVSRGSVVRVHNPGTGRTVYVKVLGPMPRTKQYAGAVIGISAAAKAELGVRGDARAWCELSYAGY